MLRRNGNLNNKFKVRATGTSKGNEQASEAKAGYLYKGTKDYTYVKEYETGRRKLVS